MHPSSCLFVVRYFCSAVDKRVVVTNHMQFTAGVTTLFYIALQRAALAITNRSWCVLEIIRSTVLGWLLSTIICRNYCFHALVLASNCRQLELVFVPDYNMRFCIVVHMFMSKVQTTSDWVCSQLLGSGIACANNKRQTTVYVEICISLICLWCFA